MLLFSSPSRCSALLHPHRLKLRPPSVNHHETCFKSISQRGNNSFCCTFGSQQVLLSCVTDELKWKLHERRQKSGKTSVRFEMPYNIWCGGCNSTIAKGVRFNAEKKQVGNYYSTKVCEFEHWKNDHFDGSFGIAPLHLSVPVNRITRSRLNGNNFVQAEH